MASNTVKEEFNVFFFGQSNYVDEIINMILSDCQYKNFQYGNIQFLYKQIEHKSHTFKLWQETKLFYCILLITLVLKI